jgi:NAD(P)-dependent dehydrogenase (short-subunit alcohol dehydrogenase family)
MHPTGLEDWSISSLIFRLTGSIAASAQAQHAGDDLNGGHPTALRYTPLRRLGEGSDIDYAALYLCSPAASRVSGQMLTVCGVGVQKLK